MGGVFKRASDKKRGKQGKYTVWWIDAQGKKRSRVGFTDRAASLELAQKLEVEAGRAREGIVSVADIARRAAERTPLADHVAAYAANIVAKGGTDLHSRRAASALRRLLADARVESLADLTGDAIQAALSRIRSRRSPRTANFGLVQAKAFCRWLVAGKKLESSPVAHLKAYSQHVGRKRVRRALTSAEAARLVAAAEAGPVLRVRLGTGDFAELSGPDRAMLYRLALGTGYRADEIRSLTPESFRLDGSPPLVTLPAESTKDGKPAEQPIRRELADRLRPWLEGKTPGKPVVPVPIKTAQLVRGDLERAGIPWQTPDGDIDFHALRGTYATLLIRAGADIKTAQVLMRHASPVMTLALYARSSEADRVKAVESMPDLDSIP